ncbi:DNA helicase UvrD [Malaciobacter canalis]|uniref:DNA 3'-5' helicase n=1 Tax=Malaciobacter canalis TaxID=1912871 RepID=A0ABX4LPY9_9BACT|nr:ATP-dependent DNA helicase [Malaciobacter canalis]PHO09602.1 DNA helicase UvrD [Malaciobacter canalis]QEE31671.1 putative helicase [Malaciobacter canalis]
MLSKQQQISVNTLDKPLLIIAGPGSGKTFTLTERIANLVVNHNVEPSQIMISTFTEKAAKELLTRISNKITQLGLKVNINEFYLGTLHSIFLELIDEHLEYSLFNKNYSVLDDFDQKFFIYRKVNSFFYKIDGLKEYVKAQSKWDKAQYLLGVFNKFTEENLDIELLKSSQDKELNYLASAYELYMTFMQEENCIDFALIQKEFYRIICEYPEVLEKIQNQIQYFMIDEYQDTNTLQELILLKLASKHQKICVVGDDDQSLYRFRGATVRNILEFQNNFKECEVVKLETNYRSHNDIIKYYNEFINEVEWSDDNNNYRHFKVIEPPKEATFEEQPVILKVSEDNEELWQQEVISFIQHCQDKKIVEDLNQITFLANSVKNTRIKNLIETLEANEIPVYSPRSDFYFQRDEIKLLIGFLLFIFKRYLDDYKTSEFKISTVDDYFIPCITLATNYIKTNIDTNKDLLEFLRTKAKIYTNLDVGKSTDDNITSIIYELIQFEPFASALDTNELATRNISMFINLCVKFESYYSVSVLTEKKLDIVLRSFFSIFLNFLYKGGISEYEDNEVLAPSGAVSFMTIHQSKGMEFPITVVTGLHHRPRSQYSKLDELIAPYLTKDEFEPVERMAEFDFMRLFYTAYSRAQNILVLSDMQRPKGSSKIPSKQLESSFKKALDWKDESFQNATYELESVKKADINHEYTFTSHISIYETCPLQYKFYRELEFTPARSGTIVFGTLVHQTIEDIHKDSMKSGFKTIPDHTIEQWFNTNYNLLVLKENAYLDQRVLKAALNQVKSYYKRNQVRISEIVAAEVDVSVLRNDYILKGVIDLIQGKDATVEIVDFKATKKPKDMNNKRLLSYKRQLEVYSHIVEERYNKKVSKMHLYYTGETENEPKITFNKQQSDMDKTLKEFDKIVEKIEAKDFDVEQRPLDLCKECDFRYYCARTKPEDKCTKGKFFK